MNIANTVVRMCLSANLPDSSGFRHAYKSALSQIRSPLGWWIERGTNKEKLLEAYKGLDKYEKKALRVAVEAAMSGTETAWRYTKSYSDPVKDWGGMSVTTNEELIRKRIEYFGEDTVREVEITPKDVMLHWKMDDIDTRALQNFESYDEQEVILKPDANPTEVPLKTSSQNGPVLIDEEGFYGDVYTMDVTDDAFVHFTYENRAQEILESGYLLDKAPYQEIGIVGVQAVSIVWGRLVPTVQYNHLDDGPLVAVTFQTNTQPEVGHPEEVIWKTDVRLKSPSIVPFEKGKSLLKNTPHEIPEGTVKYS